jgi:hypothetical protein
MASLLRDHAKQGTTLLRPGIGAATVTHIELMIEAMLQCLTDWLLGIVETYSSSVPSVPLHRLCQQCQAHTDTSTKAPQTCLQ